MLHLATFLSFGVLSSASAGLAFSGGGVPGSVSAICYFELLNVFKNYPHVMVSTVSGGSLGYFVASQKPPLSFPAALYDDAALANATYDVLSKPIVAPGEIWFGAGTSVDPIKVAEEGGFPLNHGGWWKDYLRLLLKKYNITFPVGMPRAPFTRVGFSTFNRSHGPAIRDQTTHSVPDAPSFLQYVTYDVALNSVSSPRHPVTLAGGVEDAVAASTAFWAGGIVTSKLGYTLGRAALLEAEGGVDGYYTMDGGLTEVTGIVGLLQKQTTHIVAFFEDLWYVAEDSASLAYMFGVKDGVTQKGNGELPGPVFSQVFDSSLWSEVAAQLENTTSVDGPAAHLKNVRVMSNSFFGVQEYVLEELLIIGNGGTPAFVRSIRDPEVAAHLDSNFPSHYTTHIDPFDANLLCAYSGWKVRRHWAEISRMLDA